MLVRKNMIAVIQALGSMRTARRSLAMILYFDASSLV